MFGDLWQAVEVHALVSANYKGTWHEARVVAANGDGTYNVCWTADSTYSSNVEAVPLEQAKQEQAEAVKEEVAVADAPEEQPEIAFEVHDAVEALYQDTYHNAEIVAINGDGESYNVRWVEDNTYSRVASVRARAAA